MLLLSLGGQDEYSGADSLPVIQPPSLFSLDTSSSSHTYPTVLHRAIDVLSTAMGAIMAGGDEFPMNRAHDCRWEQFRALLPERDVNHPLGCHRARIPERVVFEKLVEVLMFGCSPSGSADR
jgi:hypothetical protein